VRAFALAAGALLAILVGVTSVDGSTARAEPDATQVLDRTFACAIDPRGGAYILDARAHSGARLRGKWAKLPYAGLRAGNFGGDTGNMLAWVTAGTPTATTTIDQEFETFDVKTYGTFGVRGEPCRQAATPVPLTPAGLKGVVASRLGEKVECFAPQRVLVHIRAVLRSKGTFRRGPDYQSLHVPAREAKLAVRTLTGKPLVYADVAESGRARLFTAKGCTSE
jgi:hypothetical protein